MRCKACNVALNDIDSTRKSTATGEYYDLCGVCYQYMKENLTTLEDKFEVDKSQSGNTAQNNY